MPKQNTSMADECRACLGRVNLADLIPSEGIPHDLYKLSVSTLSQSLSQYSAAIVQFPPTDGALLRCCLDSARLYFHQKSLYPSTETLHSNGSREWCRTSGYYADPQTWLETYDYRPGLTDIEHDSGIDFPLAGLSEIFALLAKASRYILDAISFYLNLRSSSFGEILDNVPLRGREISSSVLSVCCHGRPSFQEAQHHNFTAQDDGELGLFHDHEQHTDKSLISILKTDKVGLHIHDIHGRWVLVDGDLGPQDTVVYPGLALYQATAGYVSPALLRMDVNNLQDNMLGRCSLAFKLMPKSMASLNCSEMMAAGHGVEAQFQIPIQVDDFMQRPHPVDQSLNRGCFPSFIYAKEDDQQMASDIKVPERFKSLIVQLNVEYGVLDRMVYKNKNQHHRCSYFQYLMKVRRYVRLLLSAHLDEVLDSCFSIINTTHTKARQVPERLKRRKSNFQQNDVLDRLRGIARLLNEIVEPILRAALEISTLLARSFFVTFCVVLLALLARLRVLVQQILIDVVAVFNEVSTTTQQKQPVKLAEGIEIFGEYFQRKKEIVILECVWETDKYVLREQMEAIGSENGTKMSEALAVQYQSIDTVLTCKSDED